MLVAFLLLAVKIGVGFRRLRGAVNFGAGENARAVLEVVLTDVDKAGVLVDRNSQFWAGGEEEEEEEEEADKLQLSVE